MVLNRTCTLKVGCLARADAAVAMQCAPMLWAVTGQHSCGGSTVPGMLHGPRCADRPMGFCTLECSRALCAVQVQRNNWEGAFQMPGLQVERQAPMRSLLPSWPPGPLFALQESFPKQTAAKGGRK